jgi:hypothetical protein
MCWCATFHDASLACKCKIPSSRLNTLRARTGAAVCVDENTLGRAACLDQSEAAWRNAVLEQSPSFAEHNRKDRDTIFVDEIGSDQCL